MPGALSAGSVSLTVKGDAKGFGAKLASDISREAKSSGLSGIGKAIGGTLMAGIGVAVAGIGLMVATGVKEASDASARNAQLTAGIKATGNAAGVTISGLQKYNDSLRDMSGQTGDSIATAQQLLLTFTSIKNSGPDKVFDQATLAATNMAAKMGGDASSQAILLGKALNDPVKGISALTRVGVSFSQGQKDSIKAMVDSGNTMGAQKIILKELNTEFGGAAEAAGNSLPGQLAKGKRAFEAMSQSVVETFLPMVVPAISKVAGALKNMAPVIQAGAKAVRDWLIKAWQDLQPAVSTVWGILKGFGGWLVGTLVPAVAAFGGWIKDNSKWLLGLAVVVGSMILAFKAYVAVMGVVRIATMVWAVAQGILNGTIAVNPVAIIIMAIVGLIAAIVYVATQTQFFQNVWKVATQAIGAAVSWVWNSVLKPTFDFIGGAVNVVGDIIGKVFGAVGGIIKGAFEGVVGFVKGYFNTIGGLINGIIDGINGVTGLGAAIGINIGKIPHLPKLEKGGTVIQPGSVLVGEKGPEVLNLPSGASVVPLDKATTGSNRPIYADGIGLIGWIRQLANGEAKLVWNNGVNSAVAAGYGGKR